MRTTFTREIDKPQPPDTLLTQNSPDDGEESVSKWPVKIKFRKKLYARIYRPGKGRDSYRVAWMATGKRQMKSFRTYAGEDGAKKFAEDLAKDLAQQSPVALLTAPQAEDALAALSILNTYQAKSGRSASLTTAASIFCESALKLGDRPIPEAVNGYLHTVATVQKKDIGEAVEEFLAGKEVLTQSTDGKRSQLSPKYAYVRSLQLRRFAGTFKGHLVSDLTKVHLDSFVQDLGNLKSKSRNQRKIKSAKSRNHYRGAIRQFLAWCVRKDYLPVNHRLFEADGLRSELANTAETGFYTPKEFTKLVNGAIGKFERLRPTIAIAGLSGLRTEEILRLDWETLWRRPGYIEISIETAKTRQRRVVEICASLAAWLKPYRQGYTGKLWPLHEVTLHQHIARLCKSVDVARKNNGFRHSFATYHYALHGNENATAQQTGDTPAMLHAHYKGLATRAEGQEWFAIHPKTQKAPRVHM